MMSQCKATIPTVATLSGQYRCLVNEGHPGEHRWDAQYYRDEIARLQTALEEAREERDHWKAWEEAAQTNMYRAYEERDEAQGQPAEGFKSLEEWGQTEALSSEELGAWKRSPVTRLESRVIASIDALRTALEGAEARDRLRGEALDSLETVARSYLQYSLKGEEPGYDAKDVLAYCDEARTAIDTTPEEAKEK